MKVTKNDLIRLYTKFFRAEDTVRRGSPFVPMREIIEVYKCLILHSIIEKWDPEKIFSTPNLLLVSTDFETGISRPHYAFSESVYLLGKYQFANTLKEPWDAEAYAIRKVQEAEAVGKNEGVTGLRGDSDYYAEAEFSNGRNAMLVNIVSTTKDDHRGGVGKLKFDPQFEAEVLFQWRTLEELAKETMVTEHQLGAAPIPKKFALNEICFRAGVEYSEGLGCVQVQYAEPILEDDRLYDTVVRFASRPEKLEKIHSSGLLTEREYRIAEQAGEIYCPRNYSAHPSTLFEEPHDQKLLQLAFELLCMVCKEKDR